LSAGGSANEELDGVSALWYAVTQEREDLAADLIGRGGDVNWKDADDSTLLQAAAGFANEALTALLLRSGAAVNERNDIGQTALMVGAKSGSLSIVRMLLAAGADVNLVDKRGYNALHWTASGGDYDDVAKTLLAAGASRTQRTEREMTPLDFSRRLARERMVELLEQASTRN